MAHILFCRTCRVYTMRDRCPRCGSPTVPNKPARFSPQDHYGAYRRKLKQLEATSP